MAYMNQAKKADIAAALKKVMPRDWKYSLSVQHHSAITLTIKSAPVDLIAACLNPPRQNQTYMAVNEFYLNNSYNGDLLAIFQNIVNAMNTGNHDNSDSQSDYYDIGHYVNITVGNYAQPFIVK